MSGRERFLAGGQAPNISCPEHGESRRIAEIPLTSGPVEVPEGAREGGARPCLEEAGQVPREWEVTGFRRIEYGNPAQPFVSTRFTYKRREGAGEPVPIDDLLAMIYAHADRERSSRVGDAPA